MKEVSVLIVEDNPVVGIDLRQLMEDLGISVPAILYHGEKVLPWLRENRVDLVMLDIHLAGQMTGIDVAQKLMSEFQLPVIFLTAFQDQETVQKALATAPAAFLSKPFRNADVMAAIDLALRKVAAAPTVEEEPVSENLGAVFQAGSWLFCKSGPAFRRVEAASIHYIEADGSYSHFVTATGRITVTEPLGKIEDKLNKDQFSRIHRSYMVNLSHVTGFDSRTVNAEGKELPLSKAWEESFFAALRRMR